MLFNGRRLLNSSNCDQCSSTLLKYRIESNSQVMVPMYLSIAVIVVAFLLVCVSCIKLYRNRKTSTSSVLPISTPVVNQSSLIARLSTSHLHRPHRPPLLTTISEVPSYLELPSPIEDKQPPYEIVINAN